MAIGSQMGVVTTFDCGVSCAFANNAKFPPLRAILARLGVE